MVEAVNSIEKEFGTWLGRTRHRVPIGTNGIFFQNFMSQSKMPRRELGKLWLGIVEQRPPAECKSLERGGIALLSGDSNSGGADGTGIEAPTQIKRYFPFRQPVANEITTAKLETMKVPTLLITGDADLITPPSIMRMVAQHIAGSEISIITESGHSAYWEQPDAFNRAVLGFLAKPAR